MALLGGMQRLWGPVLGVVPLMLLSELLQVRFPFWYSVLLGLVFMVIVYFLPRGVTGLVEDAGRRCAGRSALPRGVTGPLVDAWAWLSQPMSLPRGIAGCSRMPGRADAAPAERRARWRAARSRRPDQGVRRPGRGERHVALGRRPARCWA